MVSGGQRTARGGRGLPSHGRWNSRYVLLLLVLFFIPGVVMIVAYGLISRELYRGIRFELDIKGEAAGEALGNEEPRGSDQRLHPRASGGAEHRARSLCQGPF